MLSPGSAASGHISSGFPTRGCLIPNAGGVPRFGENVGEPWTRSKSLRAADMFLDVLNLCLHQPLKCSSGNPSARAPLLLSPRFSSFQVGKKTRSPLLILHRVKKQTRQNKSGRESSHQPTSPGPHTATTAEGLSRRPRCSRACALQPTLVAGPFSCPSNRGAPGVSGGGSFAAQPLSHGSESLAAGFSPHSPTRGWGDMGLSPQVVPPPRWVRWTKGNPLRRRRQPTSPVASLRQVCIRTIQQPPSHLSTSLRRKT